MDSPRIYHSDFPRNAPGMGENNLTTIEARTAHSARRTPFWDDSTFDAFGVYPGYGPVITSDTFSIPGVAYERQGGRLYVRRDSAQELYRAKWVIPTFDAMAALSRNFPVRRYVSKRIQHSLVISMLMVLIEILDNDTPPPSVVPTYEGGLQVEWHRNGVDLEIEISPDGNAEYFFASPDEEREGAVWEDIERLTKYARFVL